MIKLTKVSEEEIINIQNKLLETDKDYCKAKESEQKINQYKFSLEDIDKKKELIERCSISISNLLDMKDFNNAYEETHKLIRACEGITQAARQLPFETGFNDYRYSLSKEVVESANIEFETQNSILHITMAELLPKRSINSRNFDYVKQTYYNSFYNQFKNGKFKVYENKVVIIFVQNYKKGINRRDQDNTETKIMIDLIAMFTLIDDSPDWCDTYYTSKTSDRTYTEIYVVPDTMFFDFLLSLRIT